MASDRKVVIQYSPRRLLVPYHERDKRWACIVAHRRFGKTVGCVNDMIKRAALLDTRDRPNAPGRFAYIAPLLGQAKEAAWEYLKSYGQPLIANSNEGELWVELVNKARIRIHGADNPDRLRGPYLDGVILDEFADMRPSIWGAVIRPMLADYIGWATFIGTPKGHNEFEQIWRQANSEPNRWYSAMMRASETGILSSEEIAEMVRDMTPEQVEQELECSFEAAIIGAYYGKEMAEAAKRGRICKVDPVPGIEVHTAWDLGVGDNMAIWCWQLGAPGEVRVVDFLQAHGHSMEKYCADLDAKGYRGIDFVPHDARVRSLETGKTRVETLIAKGRNPRLVAPHKVQDGINATRVEFPRFWFDADRCADGLEALRQYRADYDERLKTFKDEPRKDWTTHAADAFRYLAFAYREELRPEVKEPKRDKRVVIGQPAATSLSLDDLWDEQPRRSSGRI